MDKKWKAFFLKDVFEIKKGVSLKKADFIEGNIPFVSASKFTNSVSAFAGNNNKSLDSNFISLNNNGSVCECFYHPYEALVSGDVSKLKLRNKELNKNIALFLITSISKQKEKYNYGYKSGKERIEKQLILLPVDEHGEPDYEYMEEYIEKLIRNKKIDYLANMK